MKIVKAIAAALARPRWLRGMAVSAMIQNLTDL